MLNLRSLLTIIWIINSFSLNTIFSGSAGIKNGSISGKVFDINKRGISGASIHLVRDSKPPIIRTTISNSKGDYVFLNVPVGKYSLGYSKLGFKSIVVNQVNEEIETALGNQVQTYVESGTSVTIPPIVLKSVRPFGSAPVNLKLIDQVTGEPINNANIVLDNQIGKNSQNDGDFKVTVNIPPSDESLKPVGLKISAPGYEKFVDELSIVPNQTNSFLLSLTPLTGVIEGQIDFSTFPLANLNSVTSISVNNIPSEFLDLKIDSTGWFSIKVPVSTKDNFRKFNITVKTRGFQAITVPNVMAPLAGAFTIMQPIRLISINTPVNGTVVSNSGTSPIASGVNQAFIKELGLSTSINGGTYQFQSIPIGVKLNIEIFIMNRFGLIEKGSLNFLATLNGQGNFTLPTVVTQPIQNQDNNQP